MRRRSLTSLLIGALLLGLAGCASSGLSPEGRAWYDQQTQIWVQAVLRSCEATHQNYTERQSPVDCQASFPTTLRLSFPDQDFFLQNSQGVAEFALTWCRAVQANTGYYPAFGWEFRKEGNLGQANCKTFLPSATNHDPQASTGH